ncbi:MAG TPA: type IV secretion system DNA-binding domain-containing protein [Terriglobales bacterium]|nr:type IV secretion system DNA-binding domain-containing protein [Terriglobales bacterium]
MTPKQEWGRKSYGWPSRKPVWTLTALLLSVAAMVAAGVYQYQQWTFLQKRYLSVYIGSGARTWLKSAPYQLLFRVEPGKEQRAAVDADLDDPAVLAQRAHLEWRRGSYNNQRLNEWLTAAIYGGESPWETLWEWMWKAGASLLALGLAWAIPKDAERARVRRHGRRLKGPELVTASDFNHRNQSDGIGWVNQERQLLEKIFAPKSSRMVRVPREREAMHFLIMGDSGTGKSALIRQLLMQIEARGESAIVYDPAPEYTAQFYKPERGDVVLNPLDQRMPYWSPGEEVQHEAEALTLAASLFPDHHKENPFFIEGPRKVFAHLLTLRPSPEELVHWLMHEEELDRRLKGTELAAMIYPGAAAQRAGVLASLNMVADSLKLLPRKEETTATWTAAEWAKQRKGWLFLVSTPQYRKRLLPLTSLWLDLLVLRLMNQGITHPGLGGRVWFVLDELATLQKLPQLHTAITENRKSNNPVVLGFQGRSQLEARYGHEAEAMFSQPATKIFLRTSEPRSGKWISDTIGEIEIERLRESETTGEFPHLRRTRGYQLERQVEPLVMASEIGGLAELHGYLKSGNLVVRMRFPYVQLPQAQQAFIERKLSAPPLKEKPARAAAPPFTDGTPAQAQRPAQQPEQSKGAAANQQQPFFE